MDGEPKALRSAQLSIAVKGLPQVLIARSLTVAQPWCIYAPKTTLRSALHNCRLDEKRAHGFDVRGKDISMITKPIMKTGSLHS